MAERSGIETAGVFLLAAGAVFLAVWPGIELITFTILGEVDVTRAGANAIGLIATLVGILAAGRFLKEGYSLKRIWLYAVAVWVFYHTLFVPVVSLGVITAVPNAIARILFLLFCGVLYLGPHWLVYQGDIISLRDTSGA